ncbi:hypothetical protein WK39_27865 [Burkholderia cepacia]|uniref:hypothetical protein n=1 Tax=Burkholderia cepacia complex TaxID=87882 RepID=UPI0007551299|nr:MULTISPECIES: hypothetical protein [Burkholderia cepacia complex]KVS50681.1 hypothetical protein WK39_27865 [Burkholderia cepacia]KVS65707.1 hypothetical protein WK40_12175 [Burkholderia cepacia]KWO68111.1 hypothetical protein WT98_22980 [Burkholderia territorii]
MTPADLPEQRMDHLAAAVIRVERLHALATVFAMEEGAIQFSCLNLREQVAIFGLFEDLLAEAGAALMALAQP